MGFHMDINIRPEIQTTPIVRPEIQPGRGGKNDPVSDLSAQSDLSARDRVRLAARDDGAVRNQRQSEERAEPRGVGEDEGREAPRPSESARAENARAADTASADRALTAALDTRTAVRHALSAASLRTSHDSVPRIESESDRGPASRAALDRASTAYRQAGQLAQASVTRVALNIGPGGGRGGLVPA